MKNTPKLLLLAAALGVFALRPLAAEDLRVDVVSNLTEAGLKAAKPTPDQPVYYVPIPGGYKELGQVQVHWVRTPPPDSEVSQMFVHEMAKQGYRLASKVNPPSLLITYTWGYVAPIVVHAGRRSPPVITNGDQMLQVIAGDEVDVARRANPPPWLDEVLRDESRSQFYVTVLAFDFNAWRQHHRLLLWRAHFSIPMWGHYLDEVLPTLIASGVPSLGTETGRPQLFTTPLVPSGTVIVGTPTPVNGPPRPASASHGP